MQIRPDGMIKLLIKFNNWKSIVKPVRNTFESISVGFHWPTHKICHGHARVEGSVHTHFL